MSARSRTTPHKKTRHWLRKIVRWCVFVILFLFAFSVLQVVAFRWVPVYYTPVMLSRYIAAHQAEHNRKNTPDDPYSVGKQPNPRRYYDSKQSHTYKTQVKWVDIEDISPQLIRAVIASEDNLFTSHNGFSERGIQNAIQEKKKYGHVRHGGSTISQQTAKNVFTFGTRTYTRKAVETYYTFLIEHIWGKKRIMEVYLNVIETGEGIFGAEATARYYFEHSAKTLTQNESATIAACLPNPLRLHIDRPSEYVLRRRSQIIILMPKMGKIDLQ